VERSSIDRASSEKEIDEPEVVNDKENEEEDRISPAVAEEVDRSKEVALPTSGSGMYNLDKIMEPSPAASIQVNKIV